MSLSTTSTTAYVLAKYSRAYTSASKTQEPDAEWQHFTNPIIRLVLDMKKRSSGELESYRCRVLWALNAGDDAMDIDQNEVTFEDIELLSFSSPSMLQSQQQMFAVHGLPLKAVYRDCIVGLRYQYPRVVPAGASPAYRRFQMNFRTASDASSFVDAIRPVCPCKANAPAQPAGLPNRSMTMVPKPPGPLSAASGFTQTSKLPALKQSLRPSMTMQPLRPPVPDRRECVYVEPQHVPPKNNAYIAPTVTTSLVATRNDSMQAIGNLSRSATYTATYAPSNESARVVSAAPQEGFPQSGTGILNLTSGLHSSATVTCTAPENLQFNEPISEINTVTAPADPDIDMLPRLPATSIATIEAPVITEPVVPQTSTAQDALLTSLRDIPTLYDLPRAELEVLVAQVVREDGFLNLLQTLDSMWKIKTFLGPPDQVSS